LPKVAAVPARPVVRGGPVRTEPIQFYPEGAVPSMPSCFAGCDIQGVYA